VCLFKDHISLRIIFITVVAIPEPRLKYVYQENAFVKVLLETQKHNFVQIYGCIDMWSQEPVYRGVLDTKKAVKSLNKRVRE